MNKRATSIIFDGKRFDFHVLPIELFPDIQAFEKLIKHCAAKKYKEAHPDRERLPKGFNKKISIGISNIAEGSTGVEFSHIMAYGQQNICPTSEEGCFQAAIDEITSLIDSVSDEFSDIPEDYIPFFDKFGRGLQEGDTLIIRSSDNKTAKMDRKKRHIILTATKTPFTDEISAYGIVSNLDLENDKINVILSIDGIKSEVSIEKNLNEWAELNIENISYKLSQHKIYFEGIGRFNGKGKLMSIEEIKDLQIIDPLDIQARIEELSDLEDGWLDCGGRAISKCGAKKISDLFTRFYDDKLPLPHIFPTEVGNLQAEWSFKSKEVLLKINLETLGAECTIIDIERDSDEEHILDLSDEKDWSEFNSIILESSDEK